MGRLNAQLLNNVRRNRRALAALVVTVPALWLLIPVTLGAMYGAFGAYAMFAAPKFPQIMSSIAKSHGLTEASTFTESKAALSVLTKQDNDELQAFVEEVVSSHQSEIKVITGLALALACAVVGLLLGLIAGSARPALLLVLISLLTNNPMTQAGVTGDLTTLERTLFLADQTLMICLSSILGARLVRRITRRRSADRQTR